MTVSWFNRFSPPSPPSEPQTLRTGYGFPSSPQEPAAFALTPDTVLLYWKLPLKLNAPIPEIKYRVRYFTSEYYWFFLLCDEVNTSLKLL